MTAQEGWWLYMAHETLIGAYSAYAIAVKHGYEGTEAEWIAAQEAARVAAEAAVVDAERLRDEAKQTLEREGEHQRGLIEAKGTETLATIPDDYTSLHNQVQQNVADLLRDAPGVECEMSGAMVSVVDAAERPVVHLLSGIAPVQAGSGDPSPDNVRAISGWDTARLIRSRKNLFHAGDLSFTVTKKVNFNPPLPPGTYTLSAVVESADTDREVSSFFVMDRNDTRGELTRGERASASFTSTIPVTFISFYASSNHANSALDTCTWSDVQLELGSVATAYESYQYVELSTDLTDTIYAGTLDWTTGVLTVTHKQRTVTTCTRNSGSPTVPVGYRCAVLTINDMFYNGLDNGWCDCLKPVKTMWNVKQPSIMFGASGSGNTLYMAYPEERLGTTLESAIAYLEANPPTIVYPLQTAQVIQLTPQQLDMLKGCNTLRSGAGDTAMTYIADTKMYIDNQFTALQNAILAQGANI